MIVRLDLADLLGEQDLVVALAVEDLLARLAHAGRAERVGLARPAERRLHLLPRLQQRLVRPLRHEAGVRLDAVQRIEHHPGALGGVGQPLLDVLDRLVRHLGPLRSCSGRGRSSRPGHVGFQRRHYDKRPIHKAQEFPEQAIPSADWAESGVSGHRTGDDRTRLRPIEVHCIAGGCPPLRPPPMLDTVWILLALLQGPAPVAAPPLPAVVDAGMLPASAIVSPPLTAPPPPQPPVLAQAKPPAPKAPECQGQGRTVLCLDGGYGFHPDHRHGRRSRLDPGPVASRSHGSTSCTRAPTAPPALSG